MKFSRPQFGGGLPSLPALPTMGSTKCCCHIVTLAAAAGVFQLVIMALIISNSGAIYDQWNVWSTLPNDKTPPFNPSNNQPIVTSGRPFLLISLANTIAFYCVWAVVLFVYAMAFRYYQAVMVIPDLILQGLSILWTGMIIGYLGQYLGELQQAQPQQIQTQPGQMLPLERERLTFLTTAMVFAVIILAVQLVLLGVVVKFYFFLKSGGQERPNQISPVMGNTQLPDSQDSKRDKKHRHHNKPQLAPLEKKDPEIQP